MAYTYADLVRDMRAGTHPIQQIGKKHMKMDEFSIHDVVPYLEQALPGFAPRLIDSSFGDKGVTLSVKAMQAFGAYATVSPELMFPLRAGGRGYELQRQVDEFIRRTRADMIQKLGLQQEIDKQVQQSLQRERQNIENAAYQRAYKDALSQVAREARDAEDERAARLWNLTMGRDLPAKPEPGEPLDRDH